MEKVEKLAKGRPKGQLTTKMNYKLYFYNPLTNEYNYLGDYTTFIQMAEYFKKPKLRYYQPSITKYLQQSWWIGSCFLQQH